MEKDVLETKQLAENIDNSLWRRNYRLRGLKEGEEGENLVSYLEDLLTACLGSGSNIEVKLSFAFRVNTNTRTARNKEQEILLSFQDVATKSAVLDALWDQPRLEADGQQLVFYSDLCPLTKKKERMEIP